MKHSFPKCFDIRTRTWRTTALQKEYSCDLRDVFPVQLVTLASSFKSEIAQLSSLGDLDNSARTSTFTEVVSALLLFLSLSVNVATAERSFSKLHLIKNYLPNTIGQDRICALALPVLSTEAESPELKLKKKTYRLFRIC